MTTGIKLFFYPLLLISGITLSGCYTEDPGPVQETERQFSAVDFDRLEMGDALNIRVEQGNYFEITAQGDRRNIDDLEVTKEGSTLVIRFDVNRNRRHDTFITITMPILLSANFSGATDSRITGFDDQDPFNIYLSGASVCQLDMDATEVEAVLSGASYLNMRGTGEKLKARISGASVLKAFNFPVTEANISISGASDGHLTVSDRLDVIASGASVIIYRGEPVVTSDVSGSSSVRRD